MNDELIRWQSKNNAHRTQTLIIHTIRTNQVPFMQSRASFSVTFTTLAIMALGAWLPYSPFGQVHLPHLY